MESGSGQCVTILDYRKLQRYASLSRPSQHARPDEEAVKNYTTNDGLLGTASSTLSDAVVDTASPSEAASAEERELLVAKVMASLGPRGSGLLAVRGMPEVATLRKRLLPLAKKLALMPDAARHPVLKRYGLSTDVSLKRPDRPVSAFATKLQYARHSDVVDGSGIACSSVKSSPGWLCDVSHGKDLSGESSTSGRESDLEQLGSIVRQLGACMVEVGLLVARLCDSAISGAHLEDAIWESGSVKARLIHYHAYSENDLFTTKRTSTTPSKSKREFEDGKEPTKEAVQPANQCPAPDHDGETADELWQGWHYDYGILTVLTAPMFLSSPAFRPGHSGPECESYPGGHTGLRILSSDVYSFVTVPTDCLIVQVGEAAQIASGGELAAVAHCVGRPPTGQIDLSRETFVVFLQPAWDRVLSPPIGVTRAKVLNMEVIPNSRRDDDQQGSNFLTQEDSPMVKRYSEEHAKLSTVVPSLDSRWKEGCSFAEFSRETTAQYYGAHGRQSQRIGHPSTG